MRFESRELAVTAGDGTGAASGCAELIDKWIACSGTFSATVTIQGTVDDSAWFNITTVLVNTLTEIPQTLKAVRVVISGYSSGSPVLVLAGRNARSD